MPWEVKFEGGAKNVHLDDELRAEYPGILRWLVEGCRAYQKRGEAQGSGQG